MKKIIYTVASNEPECPSCGNWNAMLDNRDWDSKTRSRGLECRDCGFTLNPNSYIIVDRYEEAERMAGNLIDAEYEVLDGMTIDELHDYLSGVYYDWKIDKSPRTREISERLFKNCFGDEPIQTKPEDDQDRVGKWPPEPFEETVPLHMLKPKK